MFRVALPASRAHGSLSELSRPQRGSQANGSFRNCAKRRRMADSPSLSPRGCGNMQFNYFPSACLRGSPARAARTCNKPWSPTILIRDSPRGDSPSQTHVLVLGSAPTPPLVVSPSFPRLRSSFARTLILTPRRRVGSVAFSSVPDYNNYYHYYDYYCYYYWRLLKEVVVS